MEALNVWSTVADRLTKGLSLLDQSLHLAALVSAGHTSYTPPLIRSFPSKVLCHYPENRPARPFDAAAITTVSAGREA